tara:strand:- start:552 stop:761 length:210 start_codon:yes stop_codon:yes gene_type:complete
MINILKKLKFIFILIPLGIIIRYVDLKVTKDGFLSTNEIADHYIFVIGLLFIVIGLIFVIMYFEKKSNL